MNSTLKKCFYYLGIIAALYLFFYYVLPFIFKALGFAFKAIFFIFIWAVIGFLVFLLIAHIVKYIKNR